MATPSTRDQGAFRSELVFGVISVLALCGILATQLQAWHYERTHGQRHTASMAALTRNQLSILDGQAQLKAVSDTRGDDHKYMIEQLRSIQRRLGIEVKNSTGGEGF